MKCRMPLFLLVAGLGLAAQSVRFPAELRLRAIAELRQGLASEEFWPSMHAAEALTQAGFGDSVAYVLHPRLPQETDDQHRCGLARELIRTGDAAPVAILASILADPASTGRIHAAESLFKVNHCEHPDILHTAATGDDPIFALMAAAALVRAGEPDQLAPIRALLKHADVRPRRTAAWVLGQLGDAQDIPALQAMLDHEQEPLARAFVRNALARLGDPAALQQVVADLAAGPADIRTYAAETLGDCGLPAHLPTLAKALNDSNLDTRLRAAQAIVRIGNRLLAVDTDQDGIPDSVEQELGTPPDDPEQLVRFLTATPHGPGDADPEGLPAELAGAWFGHVGGDRYLWIYEFGSSVSELHTVFHSYLRLDNDDSTGRQDGGSRGVDVMYSFVDARNDPRIFTPALRPHPEWPVRGIVVGNRIYVCDDIRVQQVDGKARAEIHLLTQRFPNAHTDKTVSQATARTEVLAPLRPDRAIPALDFPVTEGFQALPPSYAARYDLRYDRENVALAITDGDGQGFERHYDGYLQSVSGEPGTWELTIPVSGRYHLAFMGTAVKSGTAGLEVSVDDHPLGTIATGAVAAPGTLFVSVPHSFRQGEHLRLHGSDRGQAGRFGDFALVKAPPTVPPLAIANLASAVLPPHPGESGDQVEVVWTTNADASCEIELVAGERHERFPVADGPGVNHRFFVPRAFAVDGCQATVTAKTEDESASASVQVNPDRTDPGRQARQPGHMALTVAEPSATGRLAWPVTSGVPFAQGVLADGSRCRITGPLGTALPAQFRELARWPDGSVKWLLVDTLVDTQPGQNTGLDLAYNVDPAPFAGVSVTANPDAVLLANGSVSLRLDRQHFAPLGGLAEGALEVADAEGRVFTSANLPPEEMVVEEAGPVRATVRVKGRFADADGKPWLRYLCRVHLYANQSWARIEATLENDVTDSLMTRIARFELPLASAGATGDFTSVLQDYDQRFLLDGKPQTGHAPGYCTAGPLTVAVRDFWQLYPKGFQVDGTTLRVQFLPPLPADQYTSEADRKLEDRLYFWCDKGLYKVRVGTRFTTELAVQLGNGAAAEFNDHIQQPLFAAATSAEYCASAVWGAMTPRQADAFTCYEKNVDQAFDQFTKRRETTREYGFFNFGDWYGERTWNWGNVEYDTGFALAIHFLRTGEQRLLDRAEEAVGHNGDVDTTHYDANPGNVGRPFCHCVGHTGGYYPSDFRDMGGFNNGPRDVGHTWCRGHFLLWNLTGNERFREAGEAVGHFQAAVAPRSLSIGNHRDGGWTLVGAIGAYQGTGDPYYLNGARVMVDRVLDKQLPSGQWGHHIWECRDEYPIPWGCKPFMTGVILHALAIFDRTEPTPRVQDAIRRGADYLWRKTYVQDQHGFIYAEAPRFQGKGGVWTMTLVGDGLAYACRLDPEHRDRDLLLDGLSYNMYRAGVNSFGKTFTQGLCFTVYMLDELQKLGMRNPPPVVDPPDVRMRSHILLPPGGTLTFRPFVKSGVTTPVECQLVFGGKAEGIIVGEPTLRWQSAPGFAPGPEIQVRAPAEPGVVTLPVTLTVGEQQVTRELRIEAAAPAGKPGTATGWVTDAKDPLALAAQTLGITVSPLADLAKADLEAYGTIVLGDEAHEKDFAGCRTQADRLARWVLDGGTLVVGQLNDGKWQPDFLPYDLALGDADTKAAAVVEPSHPLFRDLDSTQLIGTVSYDRIEWAAPEWQVLMRAEDGTPAILTADYGAGHLLVLMPSFDRNVPGNTVPACNALIRNALR